MIDIWTAASLRYFKILERTVYSKSIVMAVKNYVFICGVIKSEYWLSPIAENDNAKPRI